MNHVRYRSKVCRYNLQMRGPICDESVADEFDVEDRRSNVDLQKGGKRRHHAELSAIVLSGPVLPILRCDSHESSHTQRLGYGHNA